RTRAADRSSISFARAHRYPSLALIDILRSRSSISFARAHRYPSLALIDILRSRSSGKRLGHAAVDGQRRTGRRRQVRGEEHDRIADVLGGDGGLQEVPLPVVVLQRARIEAARARARGPDLLPEAGGVPVVAE